MVPRVRGVPSARTGASPPRGRPVVRLGACLERRAAQVLVATALAHEAHIGTAQHLQRVGGGRLEVGGGKWKAGSE